MLLDRSFNRNYLCSKCGTIRRAPADYVPDAPLAPFHCDEKMVLLSYEQTVAATQLTDEERVAWLTVGGNVTKRGGRHKWKAVMK